jgi:hypothetical protein
MNIKFCLQLEKSVIETLQMQWTEWTGEQMMSQSIILDCHHKLQDGYDLLEDNDAVDDLQYHRMKTSVRCLGGPEPRQL